MEPLTQGNYATVGSAIVAIAIVGRGGWAGLFRPQWQFKFQTHFDKWFGLPQSLKTYHLSLYNIKKDMLLTGPFAMLSMPSFDFHLPPCTEGFLIHHSPLWQLPLWQLPLFPSVAQFPCVWRGVQGWRALVGPGAKISWHESGILHHSKLMGKQKNWGF